MFFRYLKQEMNVSDGQFVQGLRIFHMFSFYIEYTFDHEGNEIGESFIAASPYDFWGHFKPEGSQNGWHDD